MMLALSLIFALIPLGAIAWIAINGNMFTVDGLFMNLIMLALSGILLFNVFLEIRQRGEPDKQK